MHKYQYPYPYLYLYPKEKVTGLDGGTALLLAIGFTLKIDPEPDREVVKGVVGIFSSAGGVIAVPVVRPVETPVVSVAGTILIFLAYTIPLLFHPIPLLPYPIHLLLSHSYPHSVPEAVKREYAAVHVDLDSNDEFRTTLGADVPSSAIIAGSETHADATECSVDDAHIVPGNVLSSSDVTTWSPTQQDFSELNFLANNAYSSGSSSSSSNSSSSSSSSSSSDVSNIDKRNPKRNLITENDAELSKDRAAQDNKEVEKEGEKESIEQKEKREEIGKEKDKEKDKERSRQIVPLLLEMTEPNPETPRGMDLWLLWFDGLKEKENTLISLLSS